MHVRHIQIEGFRGIQRLCWSPKSPMACLVGPGDSTKSTILTAIEYALSPRWDLPIDDSDYHDLRTENPIRIEVTIGDFPEDWAAEDIFGPLIRGWSSNGELHDEPGEDDEHVLTIRLIVREDLEPSWTVYCDRNADGKLISARQRGRLHVAHLGEYADRHLTLARGSLLSRVTTQAGNLDYVLAGVARAARENASFDDAELNEVLKQIGRNANRLGVKPRRGSCGFAARLDPRTTLAREGSISLHDDNVPTRLAGLATRRLLVMAIQLMALHTPGDEENDAGFMLVDEIEWALEPYRIRQILRVIKTELANGGEVDKTRAIITTHSPIVISDLPCSWLYVTRTQDGSTTVTQVPEELQRIVRACAEALLSPRVVVCEGKTELGLFMGLQEDWEKRHQGLSPACMGVVFVDGGGSDGATRAQRLASLGYEVCLFRDGDTRNPSGIDDLEKSGVHVIEWPGSKKTEDILLQDLPPTAVQELVNLAVMEKGEQSVCAQLASQLSLDPNRLDTNDILPASSKSAWECRRSAIAQVAHRKGWFKDVTWGSKLASIIASCVCQMKGTDLLDTLRNLEKWIYDS